MIQTNTWLRRSLLASGIALVLSSAHAAMAAPSPVDAVQVREVAASAVGRYLVVFDEAGIGRYDGSVAGLERTAPVRYPLAVAKVDVRSIASGNYRVWLEEQRTHHLGRIESALARAVQPVFVYEVTLHGVSLAMSEAEANRVATLPGVRSVTPIEVLHAETYRSPAFIGADTLWDGTQVPGGGGATRGEGMTIGVIDTGVDGAHPSFANDVACGFSAAAPKLVARDCTTNDGVSCTGTNPAPEAGLGHGMHVASTAAGNRLSGGETPPPLLPAGLSMSGVAPCARVISYKTCLADGCDTDMLVAAVENAVADQVDVVNYSIGPNCGGGNPWIDAPNFLPATQADVFVAAAAGNTRSTCADPTGLVSNLAPWAITVAASTSDFALAPELRVTGPGTLPALLGQIPLVAGSTTLPATQTAEWRSAPLQLAPGNRLACSADGALPAGYFDGRIAVIQRGTCSFAEKIANAAGVGAQVVLIVNNTETAFSMDTSGAPTDVAAFSISDLPVSTALREFLADLDDRPDVADLLYFSGFETTLGVADYLPMAETVVQGDVLASFSLRGPVAAPMQDLTKPDITAPGVNTYAAVDPASHDYAFMSGTSMASPHIAGAAALIRALHPDWAVDEVKSALMTTAVPAGTREDGITAWDADDVGSGRVDLGKAARAALTMAETEENYLAANPTTGSLSIRDLNLPSMRNIKCGERCEWQRTFRNRLPQAGTWTLSADNPDGYALSFAPTAFTLAPGASQTVTITATINDVTLPAALSFGRLWLHETSGNHPDQQLPVTVRGDAVSVSCSGGYCAFNADNFTAAYTAVGCETGVCPMLWASRFSPPGDAWPITLTSITFATGSLGYVSAGDVFDFYIYQDDDREPLNGALLVGSHKGYVIATAGARLRTVALTTPVVLNGPGDVVIAIANVAGVGPRPATGETSEFRGRSYLGAYAGEDPDLAGPDVDLKLTPEAIGSPTNWIMRAAGTTASGANIELDIGRVRD